MVRRFDPSGSRPKRVHVKARHEDDTAEHRGWPLDFEESVFDQALLTPMIRLPRMEDCWEQAMLLFSVTVLLIINICLQVTVLEKVEDLTSVMELQLGDRIIATPRSHRPLCVARSRGDLPVANLLSGVPWDVLSCAPITVSLMTNSTNLDLNGDKQWTLAEASEAGSLWETRYGRESSNEQTFHYLMSQAKAGTLQATHSMETEQERMSATQNYTVMPLAWLEQEAPRLSLCLGLHEDLCGNFEKRGILEPRLKGANIRNPADRVYVCRAIISKECKLVYGQIYEFFQASRVEVCGHYNHYWDNDQKLQTVHAKTWERYAGEQSDSMISPFFRVFLMLILVIWWMAMFKEVRRIIDWWLVVYLMPRFQGSHWLPPYFVRHTHLHHLGLGREPAALPTTSTNTAASQNGSKEPLTTAADKKKEEKNRWPVIDEDEIVIEKIPRWIKIYTMVFAVIPRTLVGLRLAWAGTKFLITSNNYTDLVLNAVALTVLIDVDTYIFGAVVSSADKDVHSRIQPLEPKMPMWMQKWLCSGPHRRLIPTEFSLTLLLIFITNICVWHAYNGSSGVAGTLEIAEGLTCYCQAEGRGCVTAQVLGGNPALAEEPNSERITLTKFIVQNVGQSLEIFAESIPSLFSAIRHSWGGD